ncbi:two-component regulator propeller domain-containing protein [Thalassotalea aquiviva]|uniref:ligand-binding sensor domain-containing protein n=1 Tax=Thalassotalea aquiviva TaxID=3242415 RepID=UPI00352A9566
MKYFFAIIVIFAGALYWFFDTQQAQEKSKTEDVVQIEQRADQPVQQAQNPTLQTTEPKSKFVHFNVGNRNVKSIFSDGDIMWVGTSGGAIRYDTQTEDYRHFSVRNGLLANGVFHVSRIDKNRMAIGTYGGGLAVLNESTDEMIIYNVPNGLGDAFVYDVLTAKNGDLWIATWTGVNRIVGGDLDDPNAWELYTVENTNGGVPNDWIYGLAEGIDGQIWLATEGGLARYNQGQWQNWQHEDGLGADYELVKDFNPFKRDPANFSRHHAQQKIEQGLTGVNTAYNPNYIVSMDVEEDGTVWVGTWGGGLNRFDGENWKVYTHIDGLPSNHIFMLNRDQEGTLWIGTSKGMAKKTKDSDEFTLYTTEDGLFADAIFSMDVQDDGTLWIGSYGGVARISHFDH